MEVLTCMAIEYNVIQYTIIMIIKYNMHRGYLYGVFFIIDDDSLLAEWGKIIALI